MLRLWTTHHFAFISICYFFASRSCGCLRCCRLLVGPSVSDHKRELIRLSLLWHLTKIISDSILQPCLCVFSVWNISSIINVDSVLTDMVSGKLQNNNIYTIAKRNVEGQDMLYQSLKLTNGIWILAELRIQPGNPNYTVESLRRKQNDFTNLQTHPWPFLMMELPTLPLLSFRSSVGLLRFPSTSTRCTTLCWRTEPAQALNVSSSPDHTQQCFIIYFLQPAAKTTTSKREWDILWYWASFHLSVFTCGMGPVFSPFWQIKLKIHFSIEFFTFTSAIANVFFFASVPSPSRCPVS